MVLRFICILGICSGFTRFASCFLLPAVSPTAIYWLEWKGWDCQETSGLCFMMNTRNCSTYNPDDCEDKLEGSYYEVHKCRKEICPAHWLEWSEWRCKMGINGSCNMTRTRGCSTGSSKACGLKYSMTMSCVKQVCPDKFELQQSGRCKGFNNISCTDASSCSIITDMHQLICQFKDTASKDCPKACGCCEEKAHWSEWSDWECQRFANNTCRMKQTRKCSTNDTNECKGMSEVIAACSDSICPALSTHVSTILPTTVGSISTLTTDKSSAQWSEWFYGKCSVSCGNGTTNRLRRCNTGCDVDCAGKPFETVPCTASNCPVDGVWSEWTRWSTCTKTCGDGMHTRIRKCDNPAPQHGGLQCSGARNETTACKYMDCPHWLIFQNITSCSVTCGTGFVQLKRYCSTGNQSDCTGSAYTKMPCNLQKCL